MRYRVNHPQVINETIDGEAIMINLVTGSYYSLDSVGAEVWGLVERLCTTEEIVADLGRRYDAPDGVIRTSVEDLLERLLSEDLVARDDGGPNGPAPTPPEPVAGTRAPFTAPKLEKFTDMQDLILLDPVHEVDARGWPHPADGPPGR